MNSQLVSEQIETATATTSDHSPYQSAPERAVLPLIYPLSLIRRLRESGCMQLGSDLEIARINASPPEVDRLCERLLSIVAVAATAAAGCCEHCGAMVGRRQTAPELIQTLQSALCACERSYAIFAKISARASRASGAACALIFAKIVHFARSALHPAHADRRRRERLARPEIGSNPPPVPGVTRYAYRYRSDRRLRQ